MKTTTLYSWSERLALRDAVHKTAVEHGWWEGFTKAEVPDHTAGCDIWSPGGYCTCAPKETRQAPFILGPGVLDEKLFLIITELAEAFEVYRDNIAVDKVWTQGDSKKPEGFPIEMADAHIRINDLMGAKKLACESYEIFSALGKPMLGKLFMQISKHLVESSTAVSDRGIAEGLNKAISCIEHTAFALGFNLRKAIEMKMVYNETRPYRHGNKKA